MRFQRDSRYRRSATLVMAMVLGVAVAVTAAQAAPARTHDNGTIEVNQYTAAIPYFQEILKGAKRAAKARGFTITATFGKVDPVLQFNQITQALVKKPVAMILAPVDQNALIPAVKQAQDAGVPVVTVADDLAASGQQYELAYVGHDYVELGRIKARWLAAKLKGKGTVAIVRGIRGLHFTEAQKEGAAEIFKKFPGIKVIEGPYAGAFAQDKGAAAASNLLAANSGITAFYFDNDDLALGGIQAIKERGIAMGKIWVIGTDGGPPALEAVKKGDLDFTISLCGQAQGAVAVNVIADSLKGKKPAKFVKTRQEQFTPATIKAKLAKLKPGDC